MLIGVIGKPSSGKTTILNALCMTDAKMGNYPFTTINPNRGVAYIGVDCPCSSLPTDCNPRTGKCENGTRYIPIEILDVAGLVPGASEGKGMGNQFLDDLRQASVLIHVVDTSGTTDEEGNDVENYNPVHDIHWLNNEILAWVGNILFKDWERLAKKLESDRTELVEVLHKKLTGLGSTIYKIKQSLMKIGLMDENPKEWTDEQKSDLTETIKDSLMPMMIAANKIDRPGADKYEKEIREKYPELEVIATSGLAELTLRRMDEKGIIKYTPGENDFEIIDPNHKQIGVAVAIKEKLLNIRGSTGVTQLLFGAVFDYLKLIAVFPVEDQNHYTDKDGRVLPDAFLIAQGTSAKEFAGKIHSDLADKFIHAILANKSNKRISATHEIENGDVIKIVSAVK